VSEIGPGNLRNSAYSRREQGKKIKKAEKKSRSCRQDKDLKKKMKKNQKKSQTGGNFANKRGVSGGEVLHGTGRQFQKRAGGAQYYNQKNPKRI